MEPLLSLVRSYEGGRESHARVIVRSLFEEYLSVEELFSDNIQVILMTSCLFKEVTTTGAIFLELQPFFLK